MRTESRVPKCLGCGTIITKRGQRGPVAKRCESCKKQAETERRKARIPSRSIRKECERCGKDYMTANRGQKYCSRECFGIHSRDRVSLACQNEGCCKTFESVPSKTGERRFCCRRCCYESRKNPPKTCLHCGEEFTRQKTQKDSAIYCSKDCYFAAVRAGEQAFKGELRTPMRRMISWFHDWADEGAKAARAIERAENREQGSLCAECGKECDAGSKFCSHTCAAIHRITRPCPKCGKDVHGASNTGKAPMCVDCRYENERKSRQTRKRKHGNWRRRCRHYGGYFNPAVKRDAIFERDAYRCHVCKRKLPKRFMHGNPRSPTVDHHPVPLSKGGDHDWHNVRCCCWECNVRKGADWDGQMMLTLTASQ